MVPWKDMSDPGKAWQDKKVFPDAIIISTDKTQLTQFSGNRSAYPVYMTLGNIPKALRRKPSDIRKNLNDLPSLA